MNTTQLIVLWYAGLIIAGVLVLSAVSYGFFPFIVAIIVIAAILIYTLRPNPNVRKRRVLIAVLGPIIILSSIISLWIGYQVYRQKQKEIQESKMLEEENQRRSLEFQKIEEEKKRIEEVVASYLIAGNKYLEEKKYKAAIEAYKQATILDPKSSLAFTFLGLTYNRLEMYKDAIEAYKSATRLYPQSASNYSSMGFAYEKLKMYTDAIEAYKSATRLYPQGADNYSSIGLIYLRLGMYEEARMFFYKAVELKPDDVVSHCSLGFTHLLLGNKDAALKEYHICKNLNPDLAEQLRQKF